MTDDRSGYLVETDWLNDRLDNRSVRILDVTGMLTSELMNVARERVYDEGHIPGAVFFDIASPKGALSDPGAKLPWTWPSKARVETAMAAHGVGNDTRVVLYAASPRLGVDIGPMWCTRAWWVMHHFGVDCAVLNGGYEKWVAEGRPVSTEPVKQPPARFVASGDGRHGHGDQGRRVRRAGGKQGVRGGHAVDSVLRRRRQDGLRSAQGSHRRRD